MNAMEKVAWTELSVSIVAVVTVALLIPLVGSAATCGFAVLALVALSGLFLRRRGSQVVVDERDREIARKAKSVSIGTSWMTLLIALIIATMWSVHKGEQAVSSLLLNWLIWMQFVIVYGIHGLVSVLMYRSQRHAA
jgi:amino acid transporter